MFFTKPFFFGFNLFCRIHVEKFYLAYCTLVTRLTHSSDPNSKLCVENPNSPFCNLPKFHGTKLKELPSITDNDRVACRNLKKEYRSTCNSNNDPQTRNKEFCTAYKNVCLNEEDENDANKNESESTLSPPEGLNMLNTFSPFKNAPKRDYTEFCAEYKQRFLYVCPEPLRFGSRAAVFCPIYSDRCRLPVPEHPVFPTPQPPSEYSNGMFSQPEMCNQYRGFASTYCNNPFFSQQPNIRFGCQKFNHFCTSQNRFG